MLNARYKKHTLYFRKPAGTSRGILLSKDSYFIIVTDSNRPGIEGIGECSILKGLSPDDRPQLEEKLQQVCLNVANIWENREGELAEWPAIRAGVEMAFADLENNGTHLLFPSSFTRSETAIPINGLIWMGQPDFMLQQIEEKLSSGFSVIKLKIGAIDFNEELSLIRHIRQRYTSSEIGLRLDANGAFAPGEALEKLRQLSEFDIHSIEQPIRQGQIAAMTGLCRKSPVPIALDEELIGIGSPSAMLQLMETIRPQYIILKPSFLGGFVASTQWIQLAEQAGAGWWVTSALESNVGLNAIAQWTATLNNPMPQGLGTGALFTNNFPSPLLVRDGALHYITGNTWDLSSITRID